MTNLIPVKVWLPIEHYRALASEAEERGADVGALLAHLAKRACTANRPPAIRRITPDELNECVRLWSAGHSDKEIARRTGIKQVTVSRRLRKLGCAAHFEFPKAKAKR